MLTLSNTQCSYFPVSYFFTVCLKYNPNKSYTWWLFDMYLVFFIPWIPSPFRFHFLHTFHCFDLDFTCVVWLTYLFLLFSSIVWLVLEFWSDSRLIIFSRLCWVLSWGGTNVLFYDVHWWSFPRSTHLLVFEKCWYSESVTLLFVLARILCSPYVNISTVCLVVWSLFSSRSY